MRERMNEREKENYRSSNFLPLYACMHMKSETYNRI